VSTRRWREKKKKIILCPWTERELEPEVGSIKQKKSSITWCPKHRVAEMLFLTSFRDHLIVRICFINGRGNSLLWPRNTLHPQRLVLTTPTSGGRSVSIVCLRTTATEITFFLLNTWSLKHYSSPLFTKCTDGPYCLATRSSSYPATASPPIHSPMRELCKSY
jgi:hypothetical protein